MRDFIVGLFVIVLLVLACMGIGSVLCNTLISLQPVDDNLFVKTLIGFFSIIGTFVLIMLSTSIGSFFSKEP